MTETTPSLRERLLAESDRVSRLRAALAYDPETGAVTRLSGGHAGPLRPVLDAKGYVMASVLGQSRRLHRIVWELHYGEPPPKVIDHINGDRRDNRIANLRAATNHSNSMNRCSLTGKPKGVWPYPRGWRAEIYANNKRHDLGTFRSQDEAAHAYNKAAIAHHGEFARLNPVGVRR